MNHTRFQPKMVSTAANPLSKGTWAKLNYVVAATPRECVCRLCPERIINIPADSQVFVGSSHKAAGKGFVLNSPNSHGQGGVNPSARRRALRLCVCVATFPGPNQMEGKTGFSSVVALVHPAQRQAPWTHRVPSKLTSDRVDWQTPIHIFWLPPNWSSQKSTKSRNSGSENGI